MAQGGKLKKAGGAGGRKQKQKSVASMKKQHKKQIQVTKGRKAFKAKGRKVEQTKQIQNATKAINKKNEAMISAKAVSAGNTFFLNDIKDKGKKEINRQTQNRIKKETGSNKLTSKLKKQLRKMGRDI